MFIQTEGTPNPATIKFLPGCEVMAQGTANFESTDDYARSPLAVSLFGIDGVFGVFLGSDFISVTKQVNVDWESLKPQVLSSVMAFFQAGEPVIIAGVGDDATGDDGNEADSEIVSQIKELIETRVRPAVAQDGGDIVFHGFREGVVYLQMQGACAGCPSSSMTLKHGIENMLKYYVPEVQEVQAVE